MDLFHGFAKHNAQDTMGTLPIMAQGLVNAAINGSKQFFESYQEVTPAILSTTEQGEISVYLVQYSNDAEKQLQWSFLRLVRRSCPNVVLVSEVWASSYKGKKDTDISNLPRPSRDPERKEFVMVSLWSGKRSVVFGAEITRNPDKLGEFCVISDSMFPGEKGEDLQGELTKGTPYDTGEGN